MCVKSSGDSIPPTQLFKMHSPFFCLQPKVKGLTYWVSREGGGNLNVDALQCTNVQQLATNAVSDQPLKYYISILVCSLVYWPCSSTDSTKVWVLKEQDPAAQSPFLGCLGYRWAQWSREPSRSPVAAGHQMAAAVSQLRACLVAAET